VLFVFLGHFPIQRDCILRKPQGSVRFIITWGWCKQTGQVREMCVPNLEAAMINYTKRHVLTMVVFCQVLNICNSMPSEASAIEEAKKLPIGGIASVRHVGIELDG
jgi:hypothetical protein